MPHTRTPAERRRAALGRLADERFDVLVIGGGITGAGIARDAALRGLRTALVEAADWASGTSSRSSRLVHGGVRYLEHGHLRLVFEASRERHTLLRIAPHLVHPLRFTWPVHAGARIPRWKLGAGLALYDALALFRNVGRHERLDAAAVRRREPAVRAEGLLGGVAYWDASTDDARLTLENALAAAGAGAVAVNHAAALAIEGGGAGGHRVLVRDAIGGGEVRAAARVVVNAAGPWSDAVRRLADGERGAAPAVRGTKGVHVAVPRARVGNREAITLLSPLDGRVMFVLPAGARAIIGTTDTPTTAAPDAVRASRDDVQYLLRSAAAVLDVPALREEDVIAAWAGIRPLIAAGFRDGEGGGAASASREHRIERDPAGHITVTGGKLTTYRALAAEAVDEAERALGRPRTPSATASRPLPGGDLPSLAAERDRAAEALGDARLARHLVHRFGARWTGPAAHIAADPSLAEPLHPDLPDVGAELVHAAEAESAWTLADLLVRRTHLAFELPDQARSLAPRAAALVAATLGWDAARRAREVAAYERETERMFGGCEPTDDG